MASDFSGRHAGGVLSRARGLASSGRTARERLHQDLLLALLIVPGFAVVLLLTGAQRDRVTTMVIAWTGLGTLVAVIKFVRRSRAERR